MSETENATPADESKPAETATEEKPVEESNGATDVSNSQSKTSATIAAAEALTSAMNAETNGTATGGEEEEGDEDNDDEDDGDASGANAGVKAKKRKERLEQNRISARESRKRKKTMIEELQRTVITLSRENKDLNERNESLRNQLMEIGAKVRSPFVSLKLDYSPCFPLSLLRLYLYSCRCQPIHSFSIQMWFRSRPS